MDGLFCVALHGGPSTFVIWLLWGEVMLGEALVVAPNQILDNVHLECGQKIEVLKNVAAEG